MTMLPYNPWMDPPAVSNATFQLHSKLFSHNFQFSCIQLLVFQRLFLSSQIIMKVLHTGSISSTQKQTRHNNVWHSDMHVTIHQLFIITILPNAVPLSHIKENVNIYNFLQFIFKNTLHFMLLDSQFFLPAISLHVAGAQCNVLNMRSSYAPEACIESRSRARGAKDK